ncbi:heavy-metal-associated domain-containing protein [Dialister hominis]|uniref:heavy-metal-associated domain-containing protein n=1 Tax=Dialister hominis TaxID=2582419 RepID=UPI003AB535A3
MDYQRVSIKGMGCENCEKKIRAAFEALPGVKEVTASHETGVAEVFLEAGVPKGMYEKALSGIEGYEVTGVEE